jgi:hypothetical protein
MQYSIIWVLGKGIKLEKKSKKAKLMEAGHVLKTERLHVQPDQSSASSRQGHVLWDIFLK